MPAISNSPWIVPSSPHGPCSSGNTTSTCRAREAARRARRRRSRGGSGRWLTTTAAGAAVDLGHVPGCQRQPLGVTGLEHPAAVEADPDGYDVVRVACRSPTSTLAAVEQETACSLERPPNTTATRGFAGSDHRQRAYLQHNGARGSTRRTTTVTDAGPAAPTDPPGATTRTAARPRCRTPPFNEPLVMASTYVAGGELRVRPLRQPDLGGVRGRRSASSRAAARCRFASGMAAVSTVLDLVAPGETVVAARHCYHGTLVQLAAPGAARPGQGRCSSTSTTPSRCSRRSTTTSPCCGSSRRPIQRSRSPTCPGSARGSARKPGARWSSTTRSPRRSSSGRCDLGADLVVHSATKYHRRSLRRTPRCWS